jgi:hypothetical protein
MRFAVFQYPLNDTATVWMSGQNMHLASEGFDDKLNVLSWNTLDGFLDNVIAILVLHTLQDVSLKLIDKFRLLVCKNMFKGLSKVSN